MPDHTYRVIEIGGTSPVSLTIAIGFRLQDR
jgi:flavin-binding protein dodecin